MTPTTPTRPDLEDTLQRLRRADLRGRQGLRYYAQAGLLTAAAAAHALQRPLLLTGEPGCGKTDFAWAIAGALGALREGSEGPLAFVHECYVHSEARARDLLYTYDNLARYGDVQLSGVDEDARTRAPDLINYIRLETLGLAIDEAAAGEPVVVLLDEIDKAPRDFPNDLLRELDRGGFEIPELAVGAPARRGPQGRMLAREMPAGKHDPARPFVLITSNVERQLPDPFLRRCVFYHLRFPGADDLKKIVEDHLDHLRRRGRLAARSRATLDAPVLDAAVALFERLRDPKLFKLDKLPATSELTDWIHTLVVVEPNGLAELPALAAKPADDRSIWRGLPAICCLLKTREDLDRVSSAKT